MKPGRQPAPARSSRHDNPIPRQFDRHPIRLPIRPQARAGDGSGRGAGGRADAGRAWADNRRTIGCSPRPDLYHGHSRRGIPVFRCQGGLPRISRQRRAPAAGPVAPGHRLRTRRAIRGDLEGARPDWTVCPGRSARTRGRVCHTGVRRDRSRGSPMGFARWRGRRLRARRDAPRLCPRPPRGARHIPEPLLDNRAPGGGAVDLVPAALPKHGDCRRPVVAGTPDQDPRLVSAAHSWHLGVSPVARAARSGSRRELGAHRNQPVLARLALDLVCPDLPPESLFRNGSRQANPVCPVFR